MNPAVAKRPFTLGPADQPSGVRVSVSVTVRSEHNLRTLQAAEKLHQGRVVPPTACGRLVRIDARGSTIGVCAAID